MAGMGTTTVDVDAILATVAEQGWALVPGVLDAETTAAARDRLVAAAAEDRAAGRAYTHSGGDQRVWALLNRGPEFVSLAEHPLALALVGATLGDRFLLSNISANITGPGGTPMPLHADQGYVPDPWPPQPYALNIAWLLTDFTEANGATRYVPGSHHLHRNPTPEEVASATTVPIEGSAGSVVVLDARTWHQTGANATADELRCGVFAYYCRPFLRTQENWFVSLRPDVLAGASPTLRELLGWNHYRSLGIVDGMPLDQPRF
jgi:ectoine hydroxylase-related dioxygenase (phytanoyl-CoA dioxygenase family)